MKLNILNIQDFLDTINACRDEVYMICSNGQKVNIRGQYRMNCTGSTMITKINCRLFWKPKIQRITCVSYPIMPETVEYAFKTFYS